MQDPSSAFSSSKAKLITDFHWNIWSKDYPVPSPSVLNDTLLSILSNQLVTCNNAEETELRLRSLNILSWIFSCVSLCEDKDNARAQKDHILQNTHIQTAFDRIIALIESEREDFQLVNLCLFVVTEQSLPQLVHGRVSAVLRAIITCLSNSSIRREQVGTAITAQLHQKLLRPVIICSALSNILDQVPEEVLSRHLEWSEDVFLLLVGSFTVSPSDDLQKNSTNGSSAESSGSGWSSNSSSSSSSSSISSNNNNHSNSSSSSGRSRGIPLPLSLSPYSAHPESRLLPIAVSTVKLLSRVPFEDRDALVPLALSSSSAAMTHIR